MTEEGSKIKLVSILLCILKACFVLSCFLPYWLGLVNAAAAAATTVVATASSPRRFPGVFRFRCVVYM